MTQYVGRMSRKTFSGHRPKSKISIILRSFPRAIIDARFVKIRSRKIVIKSDKRRPTYSLHQILYQGIYIFPVLWNVSKIKITDVLKAWSFLVSFNRLYGRSRLTCELLRTSIHGRK